MIRSTSTKAINVDCLAGELNAARRKVHRGVLAALAGTMIVECDLFEKERPVWQSSECHGAPETVQRRSTLWWARAARIASPRIKGGNLGLG